MKKKPIDDKKENKRPFFYSQFYDASDIEAASKNAYNTEMSSKELNRRRKRDWIFLLIGVPAFIALLYLIALALRRRCRKRYRIAAIYSGTVFEQYLFERKIQK